MGGVAPLAVWRAFSHSSVAAAMSRMSCPALLRSAKTYMRENFRKECENSESHSRGDDCAFDGAQVLGRRARDFRSVLAVDPSSIGVLVRDFRSAQEWLCLLSLMTARSRFWCRETLAAGTKRGQTVVVSWWTSVSVRRTLS